MKSKSDNGSNFAGHQTQTLAGLVVVSMVTMMIEWVIREIQYRFCIVLACSFIGLSHCLEVLLWLYDDV